MMMEFKFNEEKARKCFGISASACYKKVDELLAKNNIYPFKQGVYIAKDSQNTFDSFGSVLIRLPKTDWFLKVIDQWYWFDDENDIDYNDDEYNCLKRKFWNKDGTYEYKEIFTL